VEVCRIIKQGTTPTHTFTLPDDLDISAIKRARMIYSQFGQVVVEKDSISETSPVRITDRDATATLTQEETFSFIAGEVIELILRILVDDGSPDGVSLVTDYVYFRCVGIADREVLK
jgi:hypothetical protein